MIISSTEGADMKKHTSLELRVSVDIGCRNHNVAIGLSSGEVLDEFSIAHVPEGFRQFFSRVEVQARKFGCPVAVAMEGYNGYARPLDTLVRARNYRLFNINNLKLARFKEIFPGAAKTDAIDARKGLELFQLRDHLPMARDVLQEVRATPQENETLKRLSRRRRRLVDERVRVINNLQSDLQAVCPGLLEITGQADNLWFLRFITSTDDLRKLARMRKSTLCKIAGIGAKYASVILEWQKRAQFSRDVEVVGEMIQEDAARVLELHGKIQSLEARMETVAQNSNIAKTLSTMPGFGAVCTAELAGEIGTIERFGSESSLALYVGMANLDNSSGKQKGSKPAIVTVSRSRSPRDTMRKRERKAKNTIRHSGHSGVISAALSSKC
jgi:transposase